MAVIEGLLWQGTHLRAAPYSDDVRMDLLGLTGNLVSPGSFIDQGGQHQNVDAFQIFFGVHQSGAIFKPYVPFI